MITQLIIVVIVCGAFMFGVAEMMLWMDASEGRAKPRRHAEHDPYAHTRGAYERDRAEEVERRMDE